MKRLTINIGFITNSSSCIHSFDRRILEDEQVKTFLKAYEIEGGFVGKELWHRGMCGSFLVTEDQRKDAFAQLNNADFGGPYSVGDKDSVTVIYGDEYSEISSELCGILREACHRINKEYDLGMTDYN